MIKMDKKDSKGLCFICDKKLVGNGIQLNSSHTDIGNELLIQKIADILGGHYMVIASNDDRSCKDCVELLNDIDMMEMDLKLVKNSLSLSIKKKYGFLDDADNEIQPIMVENGVLKADRSKVSNPLEFEQVKKPSGFLNTQHQEVPTPPKVLMPRQVPWPQQILRPQLAQSLHQGLRPQPPGKQLRVMLPQVPKRIQVHNSQTKRQLFQNDKPTHSNKKVVVNCNIQNIDRKIPVSQPKKVFKCKICVKYFTQQEACLRHVEENHRKPASIIMKTKPCNPPSIQCTSQPKFQLNYQKPECPTDDKKDVTEEKEDAAELQ